MSDIPKSLGRTFLMVGFLPALTLMLLNAAVVVPLIPALGKFLSQPILGLAEGFYLLIPLAIGCLLTALSDSLIWLYEGVYTFQRSFLLKPLLRHNEELHKKLYADLTSLKQAYANEKDQVKRESLERRIGQEYRRLFESQQTDLLPYDSRRLLPTRLGNVWAAIEEYPASRYGMDGVTFWPRLRSFVPKEYLETIDSENAYFRFMISLSFVLSCFGFESMIVAVITQGLSREAVVVIAIGIGTILLGFLLYRAAVVLARSMGELIKTCFDLYRHELLVKLGVDWKPCTQTEGQKVWTSLANYIVTGENIFYPRPPHTSERLVETENRTP
jgi:hypothetical protein